MADKKVRAMDEANAAVLVEIATAERTSDAVRMQVYEQLLTTREGQDFFKTMLEEALSLGECPNCEHLNHWLIPEEDLSQMGWVSHKKDSRVPRHTTAKICEEYQEACAKKKIII